jgi:hypothetical protein
MDLVANRMAAWTLAALLAVGAARGAAAQDPATAAKVEAVTRTVYRAPSAGAVWVPGFWDLRDDRNATPRAGWVWVPGRWLEPPVPHARWDPGHWGWSDKWYTWIPAHWVVPGRHGYPPDLQSDEMTELEISAP